MDKFLTYENQQPIWLEDIDFMQQATVDALKGVVSALSLDNSGTVILTKDLVKKTTVFSVDTYEVSPGYIAIDGEVYPVKSGEVSTHTDAPVYWRVISEKTQEVTLGDNTQAKVYEKKYVQLSSWYSAGDVYVRYDSTKEFTSAFVNSIKAQLRLVNEISLNPVLPNTAPAESICNLYFGTSALGIKGLSFTFYAKNSFELPSVNGKRRLFVYDERIASRDFTLIMTKFWYDSNDPSKYYIYLLTFCNGDCYISTLDGREVVTMPAGTMHETKIISYGNNF